jgi:hypothetical protein
MLAAAGVAEGLAALAQPWATFHADHTWVQNSVLFAHLSAIFLGGGFAMATDRDTFMAMRNARQSGLIRHLGRLQTIHKPIMFGLILALGSGFLLYAADIEHYSGSVVFWIKMALLGALLTNGLILKKTEEALNAGDPDSQALWGRLRKISIASMVLWLAVILAGTLLGSA